MAYRVAHLRWLQSWRDQLHGLCGPEDFGAIHRWLWSSWKYRGWAIASDLNEGLGLDGLNRFQADTPALCVGQFDAPQILFLNLHSGWMAEPNRREEPIVKCSDGAALNFYRAFFTRYPAEVAALPAWNHTIGLGWRMVHGKLPNGIPTEVKRKWANQHLACWSLLPLRALTSDFFGLAKGSPTGIAVESAMASSLQAALRMGAHTMLTASPRGAAFVNAMAQQWGWPELTLADDRLPFGTKCYVAGCQLVVAMPQRIFGGDRRLRLDPVAEALGALHMRSLASDNECALRVPIVEAQVTPLASHKRMRASGAHR